MATKDDATHETLHLFHIYSLLKSTLTIIKVLDAYKKTI
jgi:hypothetical protein